MRRLLPLAVLSALLIPLTPASAEAPVPAPCFLTVPTKVVASSPYTAVWPRFTNCAATTYTWVVRDPAGTVRGFFRVVDGVSQGAWRYADNSPTGAYTVKPTNASVAATGITDATRRITVKYGSKVSLKGERVSDLKVPLRGVISRYVASANEYRRWAHRQVAISYQNCPDCAWHFLAYDKTDAYGAFSLAAVSYEKRYYRAKIGDTTTTWGSASEPVFE